MAHPYARPFEQELHVHLSAHLKPTMVIASATMIAMHGDGDGTVLHSVPGHPYRDDLYRRMAWTLLRQARKRAGLSQVDLGARASVTQSVISRRKHVAVIQRLVNLYIPIALLSPSNTVRHYS